MFFFLKFSFWTGGVTTPIQYFSSQRGNAGVLNKVGAKPTRSSQVNLNTLVLNKGDVEAPRDPPRSTTPSRLQGHCF